MAPQQRPDVVEVEIGEGKLSPAVNVIWEATDAVELEGEQAWVNRTVGAKYFPVRAIVVPQKPTRRLWTERRQWLADSRNADGSRRPNSGRLTSKEGSQRDRRSAMLEARARRSDVW